MNSKNPLNYLFILFYFQKLERLSVKSNKLEGAVTKSIGKLENIVSLDLSKNMIISIPSGM